MSKSLNETRDPSPTSACLTLDICKKRAYRTVHTTTYIHTHVEISATSIYECMEHVMEGGMEGFF